VLRRLGQYLGLGQAAALRQNAAAQKAQGEEQAPPIPPPVRGTNRKDRERLASVNLPPGLQRHEQSDQLTALITEIRAGHPAISNEDRYQWGQRLKGYRNSELQLLREVLVNRPPHPALKEAKGHPALKGPATVEGVLAILTGEVFGWAPRASRPRPDLLLEALELLGRLLPAGELERWRPALERSAPLVNLTTHVGPAALKLVEAFGLPFVERVDGEWSARRILTEVAARQPALLPGLEGQRQKLGDAEFLRALERVDEGSTLARIDHLALFDRFEAGAALAIGRLLGQDAHATRALRVEVGSQGVLQLAEAGQAALSERLTQAGRAVAAFGSNEAPLYRGGQWPSHPPPNPRLEASESALVKAFGLAAGTKLDSPTLPPATLGALVEHLRGQLRAHFPEQDATLERELLGRRFVSPRYYDSLFEEGVKNPEHRYSVKTFESWRKGAALARSEGLASKGRPLAPGELTQLMQRFHAAAGAGMVEVHESHLKTSDLGRLRSRDEDHVQLGNALHHLEPELAQILDRNPYLAHQEAFRGSDGKMIRSISFAPGSQVPKLVEELDQWVRKQEAAGLDPRKLAAEVHHRLVSIHPFMDGNGRTSKLVVDFLMARAGVPEPVWREGEVLRQVDTWHEAVDTGLKFHFDVVLRHWRAAMMAEGPS
jgi:hypothetical protein